LPIQEFLSSLIDEVVGNFPNSRKVKIEKFIQNFTLDAKRLQPVTIIINELLTNIMKYAFKDRSSGLVTVSASVVDGRVVLMVHDDGQGIPQSVSVDNSTGFGLQLVQALADQLKGIIRFQRENGTKVVLEFPL
jgi:two-component sensor histidine kinase